MEPSFAPAEALVIGIAVSLTVDAIKAKVPWVKGPLVLLLALVLVVMVLGGQVIAGDAVVSLYLLYVAFWSWLVAIGVHEKFSLLLKKLLAKGPP